MVTVAIGGAAGDGVREAGVSLGTLLTDIGFYTHLSFKYPSLIRGGHNYSRLSFAKEKVFYDHTKLDVLVALNDDSIKRHLHQLNPNAVVFAEKFEPDELAALGANAVVLPMSEYSKSLNAIPITRSSVALGAICYLLGLPLKNMIDVLHLVFKEKGLEANIKLAEMGYEQLEKLGFRHVKSLTAETTETKEFVEGNAAFARGLVSSGLDLYLAYPMTPSSSILHFLAKKQNDFKIKVIQPENEISVINMAIGAAYAGKRVAIGTATGGFALMQEAFSLAGITETPLVVAVSQRYAPATGAPTHSSQADLRFVLHAGHGEFPRVVLAPGDPEEAFRAGAEALNLAWKYQVPVIVLLDKHVSENSQTATLPVGGNIERGKIVKEVASGEYVRYAPAADGISPMAFPGTPNAVVKVTSYEHDEEGIATEEMDEIKAMQDKRFAKSAGLARECAEHESVAVYGDTSSSNVIVFWGSTKAPLLEAAQYLKKPAKLVQIVWLEPFNTEKVMKELSGAKTIIDVEGNRAGQLAGLIREKTGINIEKKILHYDSRPFDPLELAEELDKLLS